MNNSPGRRPQAQERSGMGPQRKAPMEHPMHGPPYLGDEFDNMHPLPPPHGMHPMYSNDPMAYDYNMMGMPPDPYGMPPPHYMPMHPSEAMGGGSMMDQMMDFPPPPPPHPRYLPPPNRRLPLPRPPRSHLPTKGMGEPPRSLHPRTLIANDLMKRGPMSKPELAGSPSPKRKERGPSSTSFPVKLYKILADPHYKDHITWLPHGRAWRVLKPKAFEEDVIPKFFRSERYASFMRQVNGWGFKRITEGSDLNAYYHEMFLRGLPQVAAQMRRPQKGQVISAKDYGQCPDFYKISMFAPLPAVDKPLPAPATPEKASKPTKTTEGDLRSPGVVSQDDNEAAAKQSEGPTGKPSEHHDDNYNKDDGVATKPVSSKSAHTAGSGSRDDGSTSVGSNEREVAEFMTTGSPLASSPRVNYAAAATANSSDSLLSPTEFPGGREFVDVPHSAGNSVASWNDHNDNDFMWGVMSSNSAYSPSYAYGQVTPPGGPSRYMPDKPRSQHLRLPTHSRNASSTSSLGDEAIDTSGLSPADLCYLTQQNRILLTQAQSKMAGKKN